MTTVATHASTILHRALDAIPGHAETVAAIAAVKARRSEILHTPYPSRDELLGLTRDELLAGNPIPADLGDRLVDAERGPAAATAENGALQALERQLKDEAATLVRDHHDAAFRLLGAELADVLATAAEADAVLGSTATIGEAVAAGAAKAAAWATLAQQVDRYDDLRAAQRTLSTRVAADPVHNGWEILEDAGLVANLADLDPVWRLRAEGVTAEVLPRDYPWPAAKPTRGSRTWPTEDRPAYLRWLAVSEAEPWLPTPEQMAARHAEMVDACRQPDTRPAETEAQRMRRIERIRSISTARAAMADDEARFGNHGPVPIGGW